MRAILVPLVATLVVQALGALANFVLPVLAPEAAPVFGLDASYVGLYTGLLYVGAASSTLVSGGFVTHYGPIRVSQTALLVSAAGIALIASGSIWLLPASALLIGIGYGPMTPASSHILARRTPPGMLSLIFSIKQTGVPAGFALAGTALPPLALAAGWQAAVLASAGLCALAALLLQPIREACDDDRGTWRPFSVAAIVGPLRLVFGHPALRRIAVASVAFSAAQVGTMALLVTYLTESVGLGLVAAGTALSVGQIAAIAGRIGWGACADRLGRPQIVLALLAFGMAASVLAFAALDADWPIAGIVAVCACLGATVVGWNGVALAETARQAPPGRVGEATGGTLSITFSGVIVGPPLLSLLIQATGGYEAGFLLLAVATALVGAMFLTGLRAEQPTPARNMSRSR